MKDTLEHPNKKQRIEQGSSDQDPVPLDLLASLYPQYFGFPSPLNQNTLAQKGFMKIPALITAEKVETVLGHFLKDHFFQVVDYDRFKNANAISDLISETIKYNKTGYFAIKHINSWSSITVEPALNRITFFNAYNPPKVFSEFLNLKRNVIPKNFERNILKRKQGVTNDGQAAVYMLLDLVGRMYRRNGMETKGLRASIMMELADIKTVYSDLDCSKENLLPNFQL